MPSASLVKNTNGELVGMTASDNETWTRFKGWWRRLEPGEFFTFTWKKPRNLKFHRKFFALLNIAFEAWEPERGRKRLTYKGQPIEKDFEQFRKDTIIRAGFYRATYDHRGRVSLEAKSIAFDQMEEEEFEKVYEAVVKVLLADVLHNYTREDVDRVVAELQRF